LRHGRITRREGKRGAILSAQPIDIALQPVFEQCQMPQLAPPQASRYAFCQYLPNKERSMTTMNISLPDALKEFVDRQVAGAGYGTASEYVRELIRRDRDRARLHDLLLQGAQAPIVGVANEKYFEKLRADIRTRAKHAA